MLSIDEQKANGISEDNESSDSDYDVEEFLKPKRVRRTVNDDSADLLGNFDDEKRKEILEGTYNDDDNEEEYNGSDTDGSASSAENETQTVEEGSEIEEQSDKQNILAEEASTEAIAKGLTKEQLTSLLRGASKTNRHVLYVTNLNFDSTREDLIAHFSTVGTVKSVRIPKKRRGGFAFVEMNDLEGFQRGFQLHNTELQGRHIKVQISEAGKKKSANKKNIMKQKNRKLAEMRNEQKFFTKSGKFYDKSIKQDKAKELLARKRWRKQPAAAGRV